MKITFKHTLLFIGVLIGIFSCQEDPNQIDIPDPTVFTEPVFKIQGTLNQSELDIQAGVDNFYMYTDYEIDSLGVHTFIGKFAADEGLTTSGEEELSFYLKSNIAPNEPYSINEAIMLGDLGYSNSSSSLLLGYQYDLIGIFWNSAGVGVDSYAWEISNVFSSQEKDYSFTTSNGNPLDVNFSVISDSGCSTSISGRVAPNPDSACVIDLVYEFGFNNDVIISILNPNVEVAWSTGQTTDTIIYDLSQTSPTGGVINVEVTNQYGCTATAVVNILQPQGQPVEVCMSLFQYEVSNVELPSFDLSSVVIEYKKDGVVYSSNFNGQPQSKFSIHSIDEFQINENGIQTKKLQVNFDCILYNDAGDAIPFEGEGFIGVAYPE